MPPHDLRNSLKLGFYLALYSIFVILMVDMLYNLQSGSGISMGIIGGVALFSLFYYVNA